MEQTSKFRPFSMRTIVMGYGRAKPGAKAEHKDKAL